MINEGRRAGTPALRSEKCPFCGSEIPVGQEMEFACPICRQMVGVAADGAPGRLVRAAPDSRKPWEAPNLVEGGG